MAYRRDTMGAGQQETASGWNERENLRREKMDIEDRAKQFMPFSALKGLDEALREQEIIAEENVKTETVKEDDICQTEDN